MVFPQLPTVSRSFPLRSLNWTLVGRILLGIYAGVMSPGRALPSAVISAACGLACVVS